MTTTFPVVNRMNQQVSAWESQNDRRSIFLNCYALMTNNMLRAVEDQQFHDCPWVTELLHRFADYYFDALTAYDARSTAPAVWQLAFDAAADSRYHVLQHLILGVNAHINYDLVFVLVDMLCREWNDLTPQQRQSRYEDHCLVNTIIYQTIDTVQDQVVERYSPAMDFVDKAMFRADEWLLHKMIATWREEVWHGAHQLLACDCQSDTERVSQQVEQRTVHRAHAILGQRGVRGLLELM